MDEDRNDIVGWGPGCDARALTVAQLRKWRTETVRHLRYWERLCGRMTARRWCRVDLVYYRAFEVRNGLRHIRDELARLEEKATRKDEGPPY